MKRGLLALVARAGKPRAEVARHLREDGYDVFECEELAIATRFVGVVIIEDASNDSMRTHIQSWLRTGRSPRAVVITPKPAGWKSLSLVHPGRLYVLAAPAFSWEIADALTATPPRVPVA
jgi:hypothetical protein